MSVTGHRPLSRPGRGPRRARPVHGQGPVPACAAPSRSAGPAGEVEAEPGFFEARHRRPLRSGARSGEFARTVEHDPMCSRGGPSPARSADVADKAHHLGPRRRRGRDPATACRARGLAGGSEFTGHGVVRRAGNPGHPPSRPLAPPREERPGHHRDPRSNHVVRRYASLPPPRTPTPSTRCRAACGSRPDTRVNSPGPHPQAHRVGHRQGRQAQAPAVRPRTPPGRLLNTDAPADAQKDELIDYGRH